MKNVAAQAFLWCNICEEVLLMTDSERREKYIFQVVYYTGRALHKRVVVAEFDDDADAQRFVFFNTDRHYHISAVERKSGKIVSYCYT